MSFGHHNNMSPHPSGPSFPNNLNKIFNAQTEHIRQLQDQINSRDKALEGLLLQVNNLHVQNQGLTTLAKLKNQETKQHSSSKKGLKKPKQQTVNKISGGSKKLATNRRSTKHTKNPSSPIKKKNPHHLTTKEIPDGFEPTKNAFSIHMKSLCGLVYQYSIPMVPDNSQRKEFNTQFKFPEDIVQKIHNPSTIPLVPENEIITFRGVKPGKKKISRGIINLTNFFIKYILALLAKVEIHFWAPDLNASSDTRYNEACQISAIQTFCQLAAGGAFEYMNINLRFVEDLKLLEETYNHIGQAIQKIIKIERKIFKGSRKASYLTGQTEAGQKTLTADSFNFAFLPDASESLRGIQHPDERLGDRNFTQKYWDQPIEPYDISHEITNEEDLDTSGDSDNEIDDDSEVVSSEHKTDKDEVAQEEGELNQFVDQDTKMEHAPYLSNPFGPSEISFQNKWSGW
ncbi:hypothetical protein O181_011204 [Austropuccinia psidii MF-1]|uniref:Uncharacterized protein n=1 Tax=Austropuccinia psidii MF-1 TaxID=1389203 RepID=A0A9Q3GLM2_9BASI|nr:hypothetical protein [Austropuccinia psidii MF-1]